MGISMLRIQNPMASPVTQTVQRMIFWKITRLFFVCKANSSALTYFLFHMRGMLNPMKKRGVRISGTINSRVAVAKPAPTPLFIPGPVREGIANKTDVNMSMPRTIEVINIGIVIISVLFLLKNRYLFEYTKKVC